MNVIFDPLRQFQKFHSFSRGMASSNECQLFFTQYLCSKSAGSDFHIGSLAQLNPRSDFTHISNIEEYSPTTPTSCYISIIFAYRLNSLLDENFSEPLINILILQICQTHSKDKILSHGCCPAFPRKKNKIFEISPQRHFDCLSTLIST